MDLFKANFAIFKNFNSFLQFLLRDENNFRWLHCFALDVIFVDFQHSKVKYHIPSKYKSLIS